VGQLFSGCFFLIFLVFRLSCVFAEVTTAIWFVSGFLLVVTLTRSFTFFALGCCFFSSSAFAFAFFAIALSSLRRFLVAIRLLIVLSGRF